MNRKNKVIIIAILLLSVLFWYFAAFATTCSAAEVPATEPQTVTMSTERYSQLKTIIKEQGQLLTQLDSKLKLLEQTSPELIATLSELQQSLSNAQKQLQNAEISLSNANKIIEEQNKSLLKLSEQIKHQQKIHQRQMTQNKFWCLAAGFAVAKLT